MKRFSRFGMIAVLASVALAIPALAGDVTVGRFYTELAKAKHLGAVDAPSAEANLRSAGYKLPQLGLGKHLTEGDLTSILNSVGVNVTTSRPSSPVTEAQVNQVMSGFGPQLGAPSLKLTPPTAGTNATDSTGGDPGNSGNGKG